ncbi:protease II PtrBa [Mycobacteroides abscessus subsp. abscessus]|nr:protease II PtrBa [Mycobacteroides abscessus subsp. abscessus]
MPTERVHHGDVFVDEYEWLRDKKNPEVIAYLEAENAYTEAQTAHLSGLREKIFEEIKSRTQETDLSVPTRMGEYWYYSRSFEGKQYGVHCRWTPPPTRPRPGIRRSSRPRARSRAKRCCSTATNWPRVTSSSPSARSRSATTAPCWPTRSTPSATSATRCGSRICAPANCSPTRSRAPHRARPGRWTARTSSTRPWTSPGGPTPCGGIASAPVPTPTCGCSTSPTSATG